MAKVSKQWWILGIVSLTVFMAMLDITIVNVALPSMQKAFSASFTEIQWVLNAYTLVYAVMLLPVSKLGDIWGRKRVFLLGLAVFTIGSVASGLAGDDTWLNIFRGLQGAGGAAMMSLSLTIVTASFPPAKRGLALGVWSSAVGLASAAGPLIGGALVDGFGWRSIFLVNLPIGLVVIFLGWILIPESKLLKNESLDVIGVLLSAIFIFSMVLGLIQKEMHSSYSWTNWHIMGLFGLSLVSLLAFVVTERTVKNPMIDLHVFKSTSFVGANIAAFTLGAGLYGGFTYLTILLQNYMGYSAFETGVKMLYISAFTLVLGPLAGIVSGKIGNRWLISGALLIGAAGVLLINHLVKVPFQWQSLFWGFILLGISNALVNPPISNVAMSAVQKDEVGMASGILNVFRQVGISFGVVVLGISLNAGYKDQLSDGFSQVSLLPAPIKTQLLDALQKVGAVGGRRVLESKQIAPFKQLPVFKQVADVVDNAFKVGMQHTTGLIATLLIIGAAASLVMIKRDPQPK
ncbi:MFS transporter [Furfurilactobacillus siliginis]|uniref:EmrB QacA subfamily drug resistance transporter n=1 Tax=Furfurilactobacillus siliginis TaxID=348151 RepID=A0A0R2KYB4_9LACO|nr:MFS transporter [Furfurilactobacillus siliginis]KRN94520.1 EmrB QacA subfamily drug resistance transporter [Furfurilactobacillus siliginis]GEK28561.1 MFS transporter [Furfurilactobacillus siliginis]